MKHVLVVPPAADVEGAARELASSTKDSVYDARQRIVRGLPFVVDAEAAQDTATALARQGLESYAISDSELDALPSVMAAKLVEYDDDGLILDLTRFPWREIDTVIRVRLDKDTSIETERADLKIRPSITGVRVTTRTSRQTTKDRETMWGVVVGCRDPLSTRVILLKDLDFTKLPFPRHPTALQNYNTFVGIIEERTPHALHERALETVASKLSSMVKEKHYRGQAAALAVMRSHATTSDNWDAVMGAARMVMLAHRMRAKVG